MKTRAEKNLEWIAKGNTGCVFATLFAKNPDCVGWGFYTFLAMDASKSRRYDDCSYYFP